MEHVIYNTHEVLLVFTTLEQKLKNKLHSTFPWHYPQNSHFLTCYHKDNNPHFPTCYHKKNQYQQVHIEGLLQEKKLHWKVEYIRQQNLNQTCVDFC